MKNLFLNFCAIFFAIFLDKVFFAFLNYTYFYKDNYAYCIKLGYYYFSISRIILVVILISLLRKTNIFKKILYIIGITMFTLEFGTVTYSIITRDNHYVFNLGEVAEYNGKKYYLDHKVHEANRLSHIVCFRAVNKIIDVKDYYIHMNLEDISEEEFMNNYYKKFIYQDNHEIAIPENASVYYCYKYTYEGRDLKNYPVRVFIIYEDYEYHRIYFESLTNWYTYEFEDYNFDYFDEVNKH